MDAPSKALVLTLTLLCLLYLMMVKNAHHAAKVIFQMLSRMKMQKMVKPKRKSSKVEDDYQLQKAIELLNSGTYAAKLAEVSK